MPKDLEVVLSGGLCIGFSPGEQVVSRFKPRVTRSFPEPVQVGFVSKCNQTDLLHQEDSAI